MKYDNWSIGGIKIRDNDQYQLFDNDTLNNLIVSKTRLRGGQSTNGHRHKGQEEVYMFIKGTGQIEVDHKIIDVGEGSVVLIPDNAFHKVHNTGSFWLEFICVFDGRRTI